MNKFVKKVKKIIILSFILIFSFTIYLIFISPTKRDKKQLTDSFLKSYTPNKLPSISVLVFKNFDIVYKNAFGVRKRGLNISVSINDTYNIGSITKSFTALLTGILVEKGYLTFDTTISEVLKGKVNYNIKYSSVTVKMLLSHTSGITDHLDNRVWKSFFVKKSNIHKERKRMVEEVLKNPPLFLPSTNFLYSNFNYVVLGYMLETLTFQSWENLIKNYIFRPLNMKNSYFGNPDKYGNLKEPWGHRKNPIKPGLFSDNPTVLGPAATICSNLDDLSKFIEVFFSLKNKNYQKIISTSLLIKMLKPIKNRYALGWMVDNYNSKNNLIIWNDGTNTYFFARIYILPYKGFAIIILTNQGKGKTREYINEIWAQLLNLYYYN